MKDKIRNFINSVDMYEKQNWLSSKMNKNYSLFPGDKKDKKNTKLLRKAVKILKNIKL